MAQSLIGALEEAILGDAGVIKALGSSSQDQLAEAWGRSRRPEVTLNAALSVVRALRARVISLADAHQWVKLVRSGYLSSGSGRIRPLEISWSQADDVPLAYLISAIDTLGDNDAPLTDQYLDQLLKSFDPQRS